MTNLPSLLIFIASFVIFKFHLVKGASDLGGNAVLFSVKMNSVRSLNHYGSRKSKALAFLTWDNKVRYCNRHDLDCMFWISGGNRLSPRLQKVKQISNVLQAEYKLDYIVYVDADVVITQPSVNWFAIQEVFSAYLGSETSLLLTLDLNYTTSMRPNLGEYNRRQTGVMFIKPSQKLHLLVKNWLLLSDHYSSSKIARNETTLKVTDSDNRHSDQWLFNQLLQQTPRHSKQVHTLPTRHIFNAFPVYSRCTPLASTWCNSSIGGSYWSDMKLPQGDEVPGVSLAVHFAGVFGGSSIESGGEDLLVLLLAVHGFVERHLQFVRLLQEDHKLKQHSQPADVGNEKRRRTCVRCSVVSDSAAVEILEDIMQYINECVRIVFSVELFAAGLSEQSADVCLTVIQTKSQQLFVNSTAMIRAVRKMSRDHNILVCCPENRDGS